MLNLFEYQNKERFRESEYENLEFFLDEIWGKREKSSYFTSTTENEEEIVESQRFLQFLRKHKELKSNKYVGVIHYKGDVINLLPKIFYDPKKKYDQKALRHINSNIFWWLSYCRKLRFPNYKTGLSGEKNDFFEILIYLFSKYTKELLNNAMYQRYVEIHREEQFVKGRIDFTRYTNENLSRANFHKISCTYDSFEMDNQFNRCIKYVATLLFSVTKDRQSKNNLREILFILDEVSDETMSASACRNIQFNPMFKEFETIRDYCVLFLENCVSYNYKDALQLFAFLIPMEYIFEDFIFGFIDKELHEVTAKAQSGQISLDQSKNFKLKPDLILEVNGKRIIADTKYKMLNLSGNDPKNGISQNDLYQMVAYAIRLQCDHIILLYPDHILNPGYRALEPIEVVDEFSNKTIIVFSYQVSFIGSSFKNQADWKLKLEEDLNEILSYIQVK
ncbi:McrBC 5-methylcytosine restriction system component [Dokdonia sp. MED134]|uniref:McrC family protein n=1 Tax=Dokdonia sp. MED134 TaxID=313590 RepID=UPI000068AC12|nr:hypothetical protein [Dokdonia sp. MED134]EAQ40499.1 McrBC 5-methylcytosine restriction system component [Dokdonia sp. MED134]